MNTINKPLIIIENLCKSFEDGDVLRNIHAAEVMPVLGMDKKEDDF